MKEYLIQILLTNEYPPPNGDVIFYKDDFGAGMVYPFHTRDVERAKIFASVEDAREWGQTHLGYNFFTVIPK